MKSIFIKTLSGAIRSDVIVEFEIVNTEHLNLGHNVCIRAYGKEEDFSVIHGFNSKEEAQKWLDKLLLEINSDDNTKDNQIKVLEDALKFYADYRNIANPDSIAMKMALESNCFIPDKSICNVTKKALEKLQELRGQNEPKRG